VDIQQVLRRYDIGAGATLRAIEERLYEENARATGADIARGGPQIEAPLKLIEVQVRPEWLDYNGHMTDSRYLQVFGDATDALFRQVGINDAYRKSGRGMYAVETHMTHGAEAKVFENLYVMTQLLSVDDKRVHLFHSMRRMHDDVVVATGEQIYLHVNTGAGKAASMEAAVRAKLQAVQAAHARLPTPAQKGRAVGMPRS
jgi:carnitine 3-dehydrogenase